MSRQVERAGEAAAARIAAQLAQRIADVVPGVDASATRDSVTIAGRELRRDARLRWIGGMLK